MQQHAAFTSRDSAVIGRETTPDKATRQQRRVIGKEEDEQEKGTEEEASQSHKPTSTNGNAADQVVREGQKIEYKKSTARRKPAEKARKAQADNLSSSAGISAAAAAAAAAETGFQIRGLKALVEPIREKPYDPFGGLEMKHEYYEPQEHIDHPWLDKARTDPVITAGGYDLREYYARTLLEAFAGLGCFVAEEMAERDGDGGGEGGREVGGGGVQHGEGEGDKVEASSR